MKTAQTVVMESIPAKQNFKSSIWSKALKIPSLELIAILLVVLASNLFLNENFFTVEIKNGNFYGSLIDVFDRSTAIALISLGMALVISTGGVDLSVGAIAALAGAIVAKSMAMGLGFGGALSLALFAGVVAGLWNGLLVAWLGLQPIVATLILMVAGRGLAQLLTDGQILLINHSAFDFIGGGFLLGFPFGIWLTLTMLIALWTLTRKTAFGLYLESVGNNPIASRYVGLPTKPILASAYVFSGFFSAIAGILLSSDIRAADVNNLGLYSELDAILSVVIGGTAISGGRFNLFGAVLGAVLIQAVSTTIHTKGVAVESTLIIKALVVLGVCLVKSRRSRA
jgi:galactofuranose transport system permease protein